MAGSVVALGDEDVVIDAALQRLIEWNWWALLFVSKRYVICIRLNVP